MLSIDDKAISAREAAEMLGVKTQTLATWRMQRRGPSYFKYSRNIFYQKENIEEFKTRHKVCQNER